MNLKESLNTSTRYPVDSELLFPETASKEGSGAFSYLLQNILNSNNTTNKEQLVFQFETLKYASGLRPDLPQPHIMLETISLDNLSDQVKTKLAHEETNLKDGEALNSSYGEQSIEYISNLKGPETKIPTIEELEQSFNANNYLISKPNLITCHESIKHSKPIIVEGPPGTGKTTLAQEITKSIGLNPENPDHLLTIFCTPSIGASNVVYEWNDRRRLMDIQYLQSMSSIYEKETIDKLYKKLVAESYSSKYLIIHTLLKATLLPYRCVVLIDELDKSYPDFDNILLDILDNNSFVIPEIGRVGNPNKPKHLRPIFILTSNAERNLSSPLKRRSNYIFFNFLNEITEAELFVRKLSLTQEEALEAASFFRQIRNHTNFRPLHQPSTAEALITCKAIKENNMQICKESFLLYNGFWVKGGDDFKSFYEVFEQELNSINKN